MNILNELFRKVSATPNRAGATTAIALTVPDRINRAAGSGPPYPSSRAALSTLAREHDIRLEHGPGRHGIGGAAFLFLRPLRNRPFLRFFENLAV